MNPQLGEKRNFKAEGAEYGPSGSGGGSWNPSLFWAQGILSDQIKEEIGRCPATAFYTQIDYRINSEFRSGHSSTDITKFNSKNNSAR